MEYLTVLPHQQHTRGCEVFTDKGSISLSSCGCNDARLFGGQVVRDKAWLGLILNPQNAAQGRAGGRRYQIMHHGCVTAKPAGWKFATSGVVSGGTEPLSTHKISEARLA